MTQAAGEAALSQFSELASPLASLGMGARLVKVLRSCVTDDVCI